MEFAFTDEQDQFRAVVRRFLSDKSPTTEVRRLMDTADGYDPAVWRQLADDLALTGIHIPETYGGAGFGPVELVHRDGRTGSRVVVRAVFLIVRARGRRDHARGRRRSESRICYRPSPSGQTRAAFAVTEANGHWDATGIQAIATRTGSGWVIDGEKSYVIDGCSAQQLIVVGARRG